MRSVACASDRYTGAARSMASTDAEPPIKLGLEPCVGPRFGGALSKLQMSPVNWLSGSLTTADRSRREPHRALPARSASEGNPVARHESFVLDDVTEQTLRFEAIGSGQIEMRIGDAGTFYNEIYDENDTVVGRTVGITVAVYRRESDGHLMNDYKEAILLPEGTVCTTGTIDRDALLRGEPVRLTAVGVGGTLGGLTGTREVRLLPPYPPTPHSRVHTKITLA